MSKWKAGGYVRRSYDELNNDESFTILIQKSQIKDFVSQSKDIELIDIYSDDGFTGTDFNRPGYKELFKDIANGKINCIIVKDLSRLGRNYIEVGNFIETIVPQYNLRLISINDGIDSYLKPDSMMTIEIPFKNLMNESYAKDSSKKIRTSLKTAKKKGCYISNTAPFGYEKDKDDYHKLVIDEDASEIVKRIFNLALKGYSRTEIVKELNDLHIITPSEYINRKYNKNIKSKSLEWNLYKLDNILKNEVYIGNLVQGKRQRISHKTHNIVSIPKEEWIVVENTHESIIDKKIFYQVQDILYGRNNMITKKGNYSTYTGHIKCSECGASLCRFKKKSNNSAYYYCDTYKKTKRCNKHYITEGELDNAVINSFNNCLLLISEIESKINDISNSKIDYVEDLKNTKIIELKKDIEKYTTLLNNILKDYDLNYITKEEYESYKQDYMYELNKLRIKKDELENNNITENNLLWIKNFKKNNRINKVTRNIVNEFIDNIYVDDHRNIKIVFKHKDKIEEAIRYLKTKESVV